MMDEEVGPTPVGRLSEVWNHFRLIAPGALQVVCLHCGKYMKRSDSSTKVSSCAHRLRGSPLPLEHVGSHEGLSL